MKTLLLFLILSLSVSAQQYNFSNITSQNGLNEAQIFSLLQDSDGFFYFGTNGGGVNKYDGNSFSSINAANGLGGNVVYKIIQDRNSHIWFATNGGLTKYNGYNYHNYSTQNSSLKTNSVLSVYESSEGTIWIGTDRGVYYLENNKLSQFKIASLSEKNEVWAFTEDSAGNLWIGTAQGLVKLNNKIAKVYTTNEGLSNNSIWSLFFDTSSNKLYIGTHTGLNVYQNEKITKISQPVLDESAIWALHIDTKNRFWIGSSNSLFKYSNNSFTHFTKHNGLVNNTIWAIKEDFEGNVWIATTNGISILKDENFKLYGKSYLKDGLWAIKENKDGTLLVGSEETGIYNFNGSSFELDPITKILPSKAIWMFLEDKKGNLWIGTDEGLVQKTPDGNIKSYLTGKSILYIYEDSKGCIWFGTFYNGIFKFDGKEIKAYPLPIVSYIPVHSILEDSRGNIWAATDKLLYKLVNDVFVETEESKLLGGYAVMKVLEDKNKNLWFALYGGGVAVYNPDTKKLKHITTKEGLNNNSVLIMQFDHEEYLWIGTNSGLNRLNWKKFVENDELEVIAYNISDGLAGIENNQGAALIDSKGNFWVGTILGLLTFNPSLIEDKPKENKIHITGLRLYLEEKDLISYAGSKLPFKNLPKELELPYSENHLTFDFVGINFTSPSSVKYQYMLEGFDKKWSPAANKNSATYSNLPPGSYTFLVKSSNSFNKWNGNPASYSFVILKPFWQTHWFYAALFLFVFGSAYLFYRNRVQTIQKRNKELQQRIKERLLYEERLAQSEKDYRGLFENAHDAILITNPVTFKIYDANNSAAVLYGYEQQEMKNLHLSDLSVDKKIFIELFKNIQKQKTVQNLELVHLRKNGSHFNVDINAAMINYKGEEAVLSIHRDISERKKYEAVLLEAKEYAERSDRLKTEFLAQMSHEIRTPVNIILSYSSLIKEEIKGNVDTLLQTCFATIDKAGKRLIRTVDSLLNMAQIQTGNFELSVEVFDIKEAILDDLYEEFRQPAAQKFLDFDLIDNSCSRIIEADKYSIEHIFTNLIHNATKYTETGKIEIIIYNKDTDTVTVEVADTGIGISEEYLPMLFEAFTQEEQGYSRKYEGNGLGLALVKKYCDMNNAEIEVKSKKGVGTVFSVTFKIVKN